MCNECLADGDLQDECERCGPKQSATVVDCRSKEGQLIGLVDAVIHTARAFWTLVDLYDIDIRTGPIREAVTDARSDEAVQALCGGHNRDELAAMEIVQKAAEFLRVGYE